MACEESYLVPPEDLSLATAEREHILKVLRICKGNRLRTAAALGVSRGKLLRRLIEYGQPPGKYGPPRPA